MRRMPGPSCLQSWLCDSPLAKSYYWPDLTVVMKVRTVVAAGAVVLAAGFIAVASLDDEGGPAPAFHVTLADPDIYVDGEFSDSFVLESGEYRFRFTPNGDSPQTLSIRIRGESFSFEEDFELEGTLHETGISEYYTWEYLGEGRIKVSESQNVRITINPNGNLLGAVSVSLLK